MGVGAESCWRGVFEDMEDINLKKANEASARYKKELLGKLENEDWREVHRVDEVVIYQGPNFGQATPAFRCKFDVSGPGATPRTCVHCLTDLPTRLSWDGATLLVEDCRDLSAPLALDDGFGVVRLSVSQPALGGVISSREFVDLLCHDEPDASAKEALMWSGAAHSFSSYSASKGRVLGANFGCGFRMTMQDDVLHCDFIFHSVVNGWLPSSVVAKAMPSTMANLAVNLKKVILELGPTLDK